MNKLHARHLLRKVAELAQANDEFQQWFKQQKSRRRYYQPMADAGIVTFEMAEESFRRPSDFVHFLAGDAQNDANKSNQRLMQMWRELPFNSNQDLVDNNNNHNNHNNPAFAAAGDEGQFVITAGEPN